MKRKRDRDSLAHLGGERGPGGWFGGADFRASLHPSRIARHEREGGRSKTFQAAVRDPRVSANFYLNRPTSRGPRVTRRGASRGPALRLAKERTQAPEEK